MYFRPLGRALTAICLLAMPLAAPTLKDVGFVPIALAQTPDVYDQAQEKVRLADHLKRAWQVPAVLAHRIVGAVYREAQAIGTAPTLLLALIAKESRFKPSARSGYGAVGLMQVVPRFHLEKVQRGETLLNPETNIRVGAQVFNEYLNQADGRLEPALKKYSGSASAYTRMVKDYQLEFDAAKLQDI